MKILMIDDKVEDIERAKKVVVETFPEAEVFATDDEDKGLEYAEKNQPDLAILDIILKKEHGYTMCRKIKEIKPDTIVILLTGSLNAIDSRMAERNGAYGFAVKTRGMATFKEILKEVIKGCENEEKFRSSWGTPCTVQ